jgi:hypothetical protein
VATKNQPADERIKADMNAEDGRRTALQRLLCDIERMLERGAVRFNDPFHRPVLGTIRESVDCSLRTVILRQVRFSERLLVCYTDARAPKVRDIAANGRAAWLFYHPRRKVQVRITGRAQLHGGDGFADAQWRTASATSRLNYLADAAPGTPVDRPSTGLPHFLLERVPRLKDTERGRANFMVIAGRFETLDWLKLKPTGNLRARFDWDRQRWRATWVIP